jgi:hypothetical protein
MLLSVIILYGLGIHCIMGKQFINLAKLWKQTKKTTQLKN